MNKTFNFATNLKMVIVRQILFFSILVSSLFGCKKQDKEATQLLSSTTKGVYGVVEVYDEYGNISDFSNVSVVAECIDSIKVDTSATGSLIPRTKDTILYTITDQYGNYSFKDAPGGHYFISFTKSGYSENKKYNFVHYNSKGDTLSKVIIAKPSPANVYITKVEISQNNKVAYITKKVELTGSSTFEYGVVTRFFFGKDSLVSNKNYMHEWVSGATFGKGGDTATVIVKKATDLLFACGFKEQDQVFVRAYIDNLQYYSYEKGDSIKVFPNLSSSSQVLSFKLGNVVVVE